MRKAASFLCEKIHHLRKKVVNSHNLRIEKKRASEENSSAASAQNFANDDAAGKRSRQLCASEKLPSDDAEVPN
jgi:hypothetical protein